MILHWHNGSHHGSCPEDYSDFTREAGALLRCSTIPVAAVDVAVEDQGFVRYSFDPWALGVGE